MSTLDADNLDDAVMKIVTLSQITLIDFLLSHVHLTHPDSLTAFEAALEERTAHLDDPIEVAALGMTLRRIAAARVDPLSRPN